MTICEMITTIDLINIYYQTGLHFFSFQLGLSELCWVKVVRVDILVLGNAFSFSLLSMILAVGLSYMVFIMLRYVPFMLTFWRVFTLNRWLLLFIVWSLICVQIFAPPWTTACQASLSFTISWSLLKLVSIESVMPSNHPILCRLLFLQSFPASGSFLMNWLLTSGARRIGDSVSASASVLLRTIQDWFPLGLTVLILLAVQWTLKSVFQHHSSKASILQCSAFFMVQFSYPYMTTGKSISLTIWTLIGKVMSLLFNTLSRLVITFLPRSKYLLILWLQSPSAVILLLLLSHFSRVWFCVTP